MKMFTRKLIIVLIVLSVLGGFYVIADKFNWLKLDSISLNDDDVVQYKNSDYGFTVTHPDTWHTEQCRDSGPGGYYVLVAFGDAQQLVVCNSDAPFEGIIMIGVAPQTSVNEQEIVSTLAALDNSSRSTVNLDGVSATRLEGITRQTEGPGPGPGKKFILVLAQKDDRLYRLMYLNENDIKKIEQFYKVAGSFRF